MAAGIESAAVNLGDQPAKPHTAESLQEAIENQLAIWRALPKEARTDELRSEFLNRLLALQVPLCFAAKWLNERVVPSPWLLKIKLLPRFPKRAMQP